MSAGAFPTVRVAAIQATPVVLDAVASVEKALSLLHQAAEEGARLAVFPETFVALYPSYAWARLIDDTGLDALWVRPWEASVDVPGPLTDRLVDACRQLDMHCVMGVNERESERPGTLYNTMIMVGPGGLLGKHRKLMPSYHERLFHGFGSGEDIDVVSTPLGRVGGIDLLGEPHATGAVGALPARTPDLGRPDGRRLRRVAGVDAPHRHRVGHVRGVRAAVHPANRVSRRLPGRTA